MSDLRLGDNPALISACETGHAILPIYVSHAHAQGRLRGGASRWRLYHSLKSIEKSLESKGCPLLMFNDDPILVFQSIMEQFDIISIDYNLSFEPELDLKIANIANHAAFKSIQFRPHGSRLLLPPETILSRTGSSYRVFTPFYKQWRTLGACEVTRPPPIPAQINAVNDHEGLGRLKGRIDINHPILKPSLTKSGKDWAKGFDMKWLGEVGALAKLDDFLQNAINGYSQNRDRPDMIGTSGLSAHLHFGEIAPNTIINKLNDYRQHHNFEDEDAERFLTELAWREFSYGLLQQMPNLDRVSIRSEFDSMPWRDDDAAFQAWCHGNTGFELVDAGMRQLWQTGWMHNRVRMVVASFLTKHLMIDWRKGEAWFWDCLIDADAASNPVSWQWVAGCGADAAPYFRIFNPMSQADRFDPNGSYRRAYGALYAQDNHKNNAQAHQSDLFESQAQKMINPHCPQPIINHEFARQRALAAYAQLKQAKPHKEN